MSEIQRQVKPAIILFLLLTVMCGIIYPLLITGVAELIFPWQAHGSLILSDGKVLGSELIGQPFSSPGYFWGRPSATRPPYNTTLSSGSNLGPTNPDLKERVKTSVTILRQSHPQGEQIPVDLVTASASGLDPDISVASAYYQIPRVAKERNITEKELTALVNDEIQEPQGFIIGESRVNVLRLNLKLDHYIQSRAADGNEYHSNGEDERSPLSTELVNIQEKDVFQGILFFIVLFALVVRSEGSWHTYTGGNQRYYPP
jgi:K+-transporting ATPase KdpC subunit